MAKLKCPKCKSTHIQLMANDLNMKSETKTSLNLNPLKPFTVFNHKTEKKEKTSAAKVGLGILTGRPKSDNSKDTMLRVRIDEETVNKLEIASKELSITKSEVVRNGIENEYRKAIGKK